VAASAWKPPPTLQAKWRDFFTSDRNLDWFRTLVQKNIRDVQLWLFWGNESLVERHAQSEALARPLCFAILARLKARYPANARRGDAALLRTRPDAAVRLTNRALEYLGDLLDEDYVTHPNASLSQRIDRLRPKVQALPSFRGQSVWVGRGHALRLLIEYEMALHRLHDLSGFIRGYYEGRRDRLREEIRAGHADAATIAQLHTDHANAGWRLRWTDLDTDERRSVLWAMFPEATAEQRRAWADLQRPSEVALHAVAETHAVRPLSPDRLRTTLRRARHWAARLDAADRRRLSPPRS